MEPDKEEKELMRFSLTVFFAVSSFSCLLFSFFLKLAEGAYPEFFIKAALAGAALALCSYLYSVVVRVRQ